MARRRAVGKELKGDVGEYSTISIENIICINSREIKDFTKKSVGAASYPKDKLHTSIPALKILFSWVSPQIPHHTVIPIIAKNLKAL